MQAARSSTMHPTCRSIATANSARACRTLTPTPSLVLLAALSILMLNFADVLTLINYLSFAESALVAMSILGLVKLRLTRPNMKAPIRVSGRLTNACKQSSKLLL